MLHAPNSIFDNPILSPCHKVIITLITGITMHVVRLSLWKTESSRKLTPSGVFKGDIARSEHCTENKSAKLQILWWLQSSKGCNADFRTTTTTTTTTDFRQSTGSLLASASFFAMIWKLVIYGNRPCRLRISSQLSDWRFRSLRFWDSI